MGCSQMGVATASSLYRLMFTAASYLQGEWTASLGVSLATRLAHLFCGGKSAQAKGRRTRLERAAGGARGRSLRLCGSDWVSMEPSFSISKATPWRTLRLTGWIESFATSKL